MRKIITWLFVLMLFFSLIPTFNLVVKASSSIWYVSPTGDDSNTGDILHPFKTLQKAINIANNNDIIYVRGGTYNEQVTFKRSGTAGNPITLAGYPGETAIISGLNKGSPLVNLNYQSYITIRNLVIQDASSLGLKTGSGNDAGGCGHYIIDNCTFQNIAHNAVVFWEDYSPTNGHVTDITVTHCTFKDINVVFTYGEAVTFSGCKNVEFSYNYMTGIHKIAVVCATDSENFLIDHNTIINTVMYEWSNAIYLDASQHSYGGTIKNVTISNNRIVNNVAAIGLNAEVGSADGLSTISDITIVNNVIDVGTPASKNDGAITICTLNKEWHAYNIKIIHNTVYVSTGNANTDGCIFSDLTSAYVHNWVIANNIFVSCSGSYPTYQLYFRFPKGETDVIRANNLYYKISGTASCFFSDDSGNDCLEASAKQGNPNFKNPYTDFHLTSASTPAINQGSTAYTTPYDFDGKPRDSQPDIGAYEYYATTPPTTINVIINPNFQEIRGFVNLSCNILNYGDGIDEVRVNITYPDHTTQNYSMNPSYYYNQTYSQIGTYQFFIWVHHTNNRNDISAKHTFQIIPILRKTFLIGTISNDFDLSRSIINIKAKLVLYIGFSPFNINVVSSNEKIFISRNYQGYIGTKFIIGMFNAAVLSEKSSNYSLDHPILSHLNSEPQ